MISGYANFGSNCRRRNSVVIGLQRVDDPRALVIGDSVDTEACAKIRVPMTTGIDAPIGANAAVISDFPDNSIAVGVSAVIKRGHHR